MPEDSERDKPVPDEFNSSESIIFPEARIPSDDGQLALGVDPYEGDKPASLLHREDSSVVRKRSKDGKGRFVRLRNKMGKYPFTVTANQVLEETAPWYSESTREERTRKMRRIHGILLELRATGKISTTSPSKMTESDVIEFIGWCKEHLDNATSIKYLRFLGEVLQAAGNNAVVAVKLKHKRNLPIATQKPIRTIAPDQMDRLLSGDWELEDPFLDATAKAALALYLHSGLRSGELRNAKFKDLNLGRMEIVVSKPKGHGAWASGTESTPVMPGAGPALVEYLKTRDEHLRQKGLNSDEIEPLFPYLRKDGRAVYWTQQLWTKMKADIEKVTGIRFKWKDCRPSYAQMLKDKGAAIEDVSKALRHSSTVTTEKFYARVRSETAFSRLRQVWEAPVAKTQDR